MPRVIGIDPGTLSIDVCGLDDRRLFLDRTLPTGEALSHPSLLLDLIADAMPVDLVAGPSGYGLPLTAARELTESDLRLAYLAAEGETGGIGGLRSLMRLLARLPVPVVLTPGVIHLPSVPAHRKVNRVDMGTADKVCATALAIEVQAQTEGCRYEDVSLILLESGGAFTAAIAVDGGQIVDGLGGSSGPLGLRAAGSLDGEVAYLAGSVSKDLLFRGGVTTIAGAGAADAESLAIPVTARGRTAWLAFLEGVVKAVAALAVSVPRPREIVLSGRLAQLAPVREELTRRLLPLLPATAVRELKAFAAIAKQAAQGAALIADGLAGGTAKGLVDSLRLRDAEGTVLDHLHVISPASARERLGIADRPAGGPAPH